MIRIFFSILLIFSASYIFPQVTGNLAYSSYLYKTVNTTNELSPFSSSSVLMRLNKGAKVKILDEFETSAMYGSILLIEIADGKIGYIEKNTVIPEEYSNTAFYINTQLGNLPKNSVLYFQYHGSDGFHFEDENRKVFVLKNLEKVRFALNRKTENRYRINHETIIVKVADSLTLRPLSNAKLGNTEIAADGYCYLDVSDLNKSFQLTCSDYETKNVTITRKVNLFFLSKNSQAEKSETAENTCTVKIDCPPNISQIYFRSEFSPELHQMISESTTLAKGKYEMIYETVEGGFYPVQQFVNLRSGSVKISEMLKNIDAAKSNISWRDVPPSVINENWKILFFKGKNAAADVSSMKYKLEFSGSSFNFYRNEILCAGGYFIRDNENINLHWNFGYDMNSSLFSCGVAISGKIHENIGTGIYEFEILSKKFEPKTAAKIKMPWLPEIFNTGNILFIKK